MLKSKPNTMSDLYAQRGVSAQKEDVHKATASLYKGLFPLSFCQVFDDVMANDPNYVNLMHDDTAGTKSIIAYLYWAQTGDVSVFKGIAQDCIVMNLDDLICTGITSNILFTSTISRNKHLIPTEVLESIIDGTQHFFNTMQKHDVKITYAGGETADVGDLVKTVDVAGTMMARWPKNKIITNEKIAANQVIVGLASFGQASYEDTYNSGIGSNGLTSARHDVLSKHYAETYPESYNTSLPKEVVYIGKYNLTDTVDNLPLNIGQMLLSPTRTYAPVMVQILQKHFNKIAGVIHCSGGGQTKCMKFLPTPLQVIKNNLFTAPPIFNIIQAESGASNQEMYQVFNMGHRLEIFTDTETAKSIIEIANSFNIDAQVIGHTKIAETKNLILDGSFGTLNY
jgi:phosphoribosylformylglycinamidine cyclo-ligase